KLLDYSERDVTIDVWGTTAIATYVYDISWKIEGKSKRERGRDLFVFVREESRWQVVWRTVIPIERSE
ncbi:MAG TPA: nuclear transport factor 2 family protein, partial [Myxococcaceae bacterium]|nr:nuclear transport factor 2 family protein [Myxococcaceae bacterium]